MPSIRKIQAGIGWVIILAILASPVYQYGTVKTLTNVLVEEKERVTDGNQSKYLIFTEHEVFENTDTILFFKWNSSDVYSRLKEGRVCSSITVNKWRIPLLSTYRNIIEANC